MKNLFTLLAVLISLNAWAIFQQDMRSDTHFSDLNTVYLQDGTNDYIVAGSLFNNAYDSARLSITRIDDVTGNIVWTKIYEDLLFSSFRGFDIDRYNDGQEKIALTGLVRDTTMGYNNAIIALFEAVNGNLLSSRTYAGVGNHPNSQGLHIIYTQTMINMMPMPGFVIAGFMNDSYNNSMAQSNIGFVMRVDTSLLPLWTKTFENDNLVGVDYDVVNNITETSDGYFLTGSRSKALSIPPFYFQEVLALKVDFYGDFVWESSYIHNNGNGIGADAKYVASEDNIYLLANYDNAQFFGVTVIDNATGIINTISSWYGQESSTQGWFGFELSESFNANNMVVHGYKRDNTLMNSSAVLTAVQTTPFAYEFLRSTGAQVKTIQYEVLYETPSSMNDFFYFWNTSIPKAYFPDMAFRAPMSELKYFAVGLRTQGVINTKIEMIQTDNVLDNTCNSSLYNITVNPISPMVFSDSLNYGFLPFNNVTFVGSIPSYNIASCLTGGYIVPPPSGITDFKSALVSIYPNPANDVLNVSFEGEIKQIVIFNMMGAKMIVSEETKINVASLNAGVYLMQIQSTKGTILSSSFVKK